MSIDYQSHGDAVALANQMAEEHDLETAPIDIEADFIDTTTGEVVEGETNA
jgi:hypothetical protein